MAVASLIPGASLSLDRLDMSVDGWIDPEYKLRSAIGESEIEDGTRIHDHFTALPTTFKITGIVDSLRSSGDRAGDAWKDVETLHKEGALFKFVSEFGVWNECIIKTASTTQKTRGLEFMLELQQVNRIGLGRVNDEIAEAANDPSNPLANEQPEVATGSKQPVPLNPVVIEADGSVVDDVLGGGARSNTVEIVDESGKPTGRYTIAQPVEQPESEEEN